MAERPPQSRHGRPQRRPASLQRNEAETGRLPNTRESRCSPGGIGPEALNPADRTSHGDPIRALAQVGRGSGAAIRALARRGLRNRGGHGLVARVLRQLRQRLCWLWDQHGSPAHRARGLAAGV